MRQTRSAFGFQLDPHSCWMLTRSMETLALRMERAAESGRKVAGWLAENGILPCAVLHPEFGEDRRFAGIYARQCTGPGSTFAFVVEDDRALAFRILNELELFKLAVSLGGTEFAGLPSRLDHPFRRATGGAGRHGRHRGADPPVGRNGAPGRPDQGLGPSLPTGKSAA